jgi:GH18 family chitinase
VFFRDGVYKGGPRKLYCPLPCASAPVWDTLAQEDLLELLQTPGWHSAYDARAGGAYLVYDGPDNPFDRWFLSVETARSLGQKLDLIRNAELAGIIVWEASLDTKNHSFAAQLRDTLLR